MPSQSNAPPPDPILDAFVRDEKYPALLRELAALGDVRRFRKGSIVIQEGEVGDTMYIILSGQAKSYSVDISDKEITYAMFGAGEYVGEMALDGGPRSAIVITMEATACAVVTRARLLAFMPSAPNSRWNCWPR